MPRLSCGAQIKPQVLRHALRYAAMKQIAILIALSFLPTFALASGFGWYVSIISWSDFNKAILDGSARRAREVVAAPQTSPQVKQFVQNHLEDEIYSKYCNAQGRHGTDSATSLHGFRISQERD